MDRKNKKPTNRNFSKPYKPKSDDKNQRGFTGFDREYPKKYDAKKPSGEHRFNRNRTVKNGVKPYRSERSVSAKKFEDKRREHIVKNKPLANDFVPERTLTPAESGLVYGRNSVLELLKSGRQIDKIYVQAGRREGSITLIAAEAIKRSIPLIEADKVRLDKMVSSSSHQGVIAQTADVEYCSIDDILDIAAKRNEKPFILILDKITDPQNMGAIIRTAVCAGVHGIVIPKRRAVGVSPLVNKISEGAAFHIKIARVSNIQTTVEDLKEKGVWIFSAASQNEKNDLSVNYVSAEYNLPLALVMGSEGEGISPIILEKSDFLVNIPLNGPIDSLNVSCAAAVLIFQIVNMRKNCKPQN